MPEPHLCGGCSECSPVAFRDVCRFEQALADPAQAQVDAAAAVIERYLDDGYGSLTAEKMAREALAAAAIVVLGREACTSCGRPLGTGTLLDVHPHASSVQEEQVRVIASDGREGFSRPALIPQADWERFAAGYRCPRCVDHERQANRQLGCPDGGTCHHECALTGGGKQCWRVHNAGPLSGVYAGDTWPEPKPAPVLLDG